MVKYISSFHHTLHIVLLILLTAICSNTLCFAQILTVGDALTGNKVVAITQDRYGFLWIGTECGLFKYDGYKLTAYLRHNNDSTSLNDNTVSALYKDTRGTLWVGLRRGLMRYCYESDNFHNVTLLDSDPLLLPRIASINEIEGKLLIATSGFGLFEVDLNTEISKYNSNYSHEDLNDYYLTFCDKTGNVWKTDNHNVVTVYTSSGHYLKTIVPQLGNTVSFVEINDSLDELMLIICQNGIMASDERRWRTKDFKISSALYTSTEKVLVGTEGNGLCLLDTTKENSFQKIIDIGDKHITALYEDNKGNIWVGHNNSGLSMLPIQEPPFKQISTLTSPNDNKLTINTDKNTYNLLTVTALEALPNNRLLCGTLQEGLFILDRQGRVIEHILNPKNIDAIHLDKQGKVWIGSGTSLYLFDKTHLILQEEYDCDRINAICSDEYNTLYVSTYGKGLVKISSKGAETYNMYQTSRKRGFLNNDWIFALKRDSEGLIWIGTSSGLVCYDPKSDSFETQGCLNLLSERIVTAIEEMADGNIMIGTDCGLKIYNKTTKNLIDSLYESTLNDVSVQSMVRDNSGDIWIGTTFGLWCFQNKDKKYISFVNESGMISNSYTKNVALSIPETDEIILGNSHGMVIFKPSSFSLEKTIPTKPFLSEVIIGGKTANTKTLSGKTRVINQAPPEVKFIYVSYEDNSFDLEFSTNDYAKTKNLVYQYCLNNSQWISQEVGKNDISFVHLSPGTYQLQVRTKLGDDTSEIETYTIVVHPPWYRSSWAYTTYFLLLLLAIMYIIYRYNKTQKQALDEEKMKFLINATHDIRTPLTLIVNPLHQLIKSANEKEKEKLNAINYNVGKILSLVNQILDTRKIDKQQMRLTFQETSMKPFINKAIRIFNYTIQMRKISLEVNCTDDLLAFIDRSNMEKVISNLISNALKYTPDNGTITINARQQENFIVIQVIDSGIGIRQRDCERIFQRFYQSPQTSENEDNSNIKEYGSGIGLNLCRMIIEMHYGTIEAAPRTDRQGSIFTIKLPTGRKHLKDDEIIESKDMVEKHNYGAHYRILLVDDDHEIIDYISQELADYYRITVAYNGKEALQRLLEAQIAHKQDTEQVQMRVLEKVDDSKSLNQREIDVVVSDIIMPEMGGITLTKAIKTNPRTSHIPVILLTSKADIGNRLDSLKHGADAFLAKPFLIEELHATIDNVLATLLRLKGKFTEKASPNDKIEQVEVNSGDEHLMERIINVVNEHLSDFDFSVEQLSDEVGMSRSQLHRKMRELTGLSTSEFIRNIRLDQAARLLREKNIGIAQVAYSLGFNNAGHFSKTFKQYFGVSPKDYTKK